MGMKQFDTLRASELYCPKCRVMQPVRERLLLVLPGGDMHSFSCQVCGELLGTREVRGPGGGVVVPAIRPR
jgi:hypothetical protein